MPADSSRMCTPGDECGVEHQTTQPRASGILPLHASLSISVELFSHHLLFFIYLCVDQFFFALLIFDFSGVWPSALQKVLARAGEWREAWLVA